MKTAHLKSDRRQDEAVLVSVSYPLDRTVSRSISYPDFVFVLQKKFDSTVLNLWLRLRHTISFMNQHSPDSGHLIST